MRARVILLALVALALGAAAAWFYVVAPRQQVTAFHGWVEADYLFMGADAAGRLLTLNVAEGQTVGQGAELFALQHDVEEAELHQARAALEEARARLARARAAQQRPEEIAVLEAQRARAEAAVRRSKPELERTEKLVADGYASAARLDEARAAYERDAAALAEAERQIEVARMAARDEDIEAASKVVSQAEARLEQAKTRRAQRKVTAPQAGLVQEVYFRAGEIVPAGRPVLSLLPPENVKLRFFVPQGELPRISVGDAVVVHCDGCAEGIRAEVHFLSHEAEYTPPVIFSRKERAKLVYRAEARPLRPGLLKVGQPVTVSLAQDQGSKTADAER